VLTAATGADTATRCWDAPGDGATTVRLLLPRPVSCAGTPIRDYIHVVDVARGHIDALTWMTKTAAATGKGVLDRFNFGTGRGTTVFELVSAMEKASGLKVKMDVGPRRSGDLVQSYCDPAKAEKVLGWKAVYDIDRICEDAWRWQSRNPRGYEDDAPAAASAAAPAVGGAAASTTA